MTDFSYLLFVAGLLFCCFFFIFLFLQKIYNFKYCLILYPSMFELFFLTSFVLISGCKVHFTVLPWSKWMG